MQWLEEECGLSNDTDFLITHIPPKSMLDEGIGSETWLHTILGHPKFHLFSHVHSKGGRYEEWWGTKFANVSAFQTLCKKRRLNLNYSVSRFGQ